MTTEASRASALEEDWADATVLLDNQTAILELIAQSAPLTEVLTKILRSLEALMPGASCSVLLLDRTSRRLHHGAAPTLPAAYVAAIDGLPIGDRVGSCGTAAALNRAVVVSDIEVDPRWEAFREAATQAGQRACWSTPIQGRDLRPVGTFAVYHREPHAPTPREQRLVDRFTHLAAVAIGHAELAADRGARLEAETARRTAEDLSHAKSQLLAAVGHEARTPIQAIVGFAELLGTMDLDQSRRREALSHIAAAAGHVMDLLNDVLDFSRLEARALPLRLEPVHVEEVVSEVFGLLQPKAAERCITLVRDETPTEAATCARADRRRLRQVLLNLIENGVRHGREGGAVRVATASEDHQVVVVVEDDGPGIPQEVVDRLFTPFAPGRTHPIVSEDSIGLGLALTHGLVEAMAGRLTVGRTGPAGTTMRVRLPSCDTTPSSVTSLP